ncbi:g12472 [Coccomyxa viridis]|uniref:G12472 protein n=1 Tax=Coccomyxa viridis TaxID=1274662 RepID=A0ABP1GBG3_9CHLO
MSSALQGSYLEELPGTGKLSAGQGNLSISIVAALIKGPVNTPGANFSFYAMAYRDESDGSVNMFGPLLAMQAGHNHTVRLQNKLTAPVNDYLGATHSNAFRYPTHTNLHAHGVWMYGGVPDISQTPVSYQGYGDNIFLDVAPEARAGSSPSANTYTYAIPQMHLPGIFWYHPHLHGSTALQGQTASGPITIQSNVSYLTAGKGCAPLSALLGGVQTRILYLQTLFFEDADVESDPWAYYDHPGYDQMSDARTAPYTADVENPLCCSFARTGYPFNASQQDVVFVNGGLQPKIRMAPGVPQLWRIVNAAWKGYMDLVIINAGLKGNTRAPCTFSLVAKDGVYLMQIPRPVDDLVLAAGNRAEVLVECDGSVGSSFFFSSGYLKSFGTGYNYKKDINRVYQKVVAEIQLTSPGSPGVNQAGSSSLKDIPSQGCSPLRPSYVADLRGHTLKGNTTLAPADNNTTRKSIVMGLENGYGCTINGRNYSRPTDVPVLLPLGQLLEIHYEYQSLHPVHLHEYPQQIFSINRTLWRANALMPSYFAEGDWQDTFLLPNLQTKSNDRMLVTRVQPGPFSGYDSATKGTAVGNNGLKWVLACASHVLESHIQGHQE